MLIPHWAVSVSAAFSTFHSWVLITLVPLCFHSNFFSNLFIFLKNVLLNKRRGDVKGEANSFRANTIIMTLSQVIPEGSVIKSKAIKCVRCKRSIQPTPSAMAVAREVVGQRGGRVQAPEAIP